jgi:flagellar hook-length control protein FliK
MPQLNVLPISVSQHVDVMDESAAFISTKDNDDFSQLIDQHLANSHENKDTDKASTTNNNEAEKLASVTAKKLGKASVESVSESKSNESLALETKQQEIATSGKNGQEPATLVAKGTKEQTLSASEQLMSFLYKADKTLLVVPEQLTTQLDTQFEHLSAEQKSLYEAQLLLNGSSLVADLSGVAKALSSEEEGQELTQIITDKKHLLSASVATSIVDKDITKITVEPVVKGELQTATNELLIKAENVDLLAKKQFSMTGEKQNLAEDKSVPLAIKAEKNAENIVINQLEQGAVAKSGGSNSDFVEASPSHKINGVIQHTLKQEKVLTSEFEVANKQPSQSKAADIDAASQFESKQSALNKKIAELAQRKETGQGQSKESISSQSIAENTNQTDFTNEVKNSTSINSELRDINVELLGAQQSKQEGSKAAVSNQAVASQATEPSSSQKPIGNKVNLNASASYGANDAIAQQLSKAQGQKVEQELGQEHLLSKAQNQANEEVLVTEKPNKAVKPEFIANASFTDVSTKATQVAEQSLEQQSTDILNPAVSTEVTQSQKTNAQLHQETIAIFRKDFSEAVKDKVMLMISQKLQQFNITLDPPELGNMQVRVNLQNEQAAVSFIVQNQQAKDALEQNMHKLRDMLAQQGVDVGDANVEQQSQQSDNENSADESNFQQDENLTQESDLIEHTLSSKAINDAVNAVDYYA